MSKRQNISSGTKWEKIMGYSRAVRVGNTIEVAGTAALDEDQVMFPGDPYNQTHYILLKIQQSLADLGARLDDVVRTRIYVTDMESWEQVGKAHSEVFDEILPVMTIVEVYSLIQEGAVVEIEATAILGG